MKIKLTTILKSIAWYGFAAIILTFGVLSVSAAVAKKMEGPELTIEPEPEMVFIYESAELVTYQYRDTTLIYSYSTFGVHLLQLLQQNDNVYVLEVKDRDEAIKYIESYLLFLRGREK